MSHQDMFMVAGGVLFCVGIAVLFWWIEAGSAHKHMREAIEETNAMFYPTTLHDYRALFAAAVQAIRRAGFSVPENVSAEQLIAALQHLGDLAAIARESQKP